ncbi:MULTISPECIES: hypothetical protein [Rhizobium/Agrobacterium group]|uniref:Uncharacterized protein n=1 Tax=Rhizobium rhizogenes TaxID=359 RepID=A0A546XGK7_RHIRH|nr:MULTISPECIES: hypothetical protein [Rhizobium/Agrobacterium group]TRA99827.1 hypothetical protein EXN68_15380 [Rhizobium rhizogenes]
MTRTPRQQKYFGLRSSTDLFLKLVYDIERLRNANSSTAIQYAAIDAAVTGSHILDWVLVELDSEAYLRLTGLKKGKKIKKGEVGPIQTFIHLNEKEMPAIDYCRRIANNVKHRTSELGGPMKDMAIGSTVKLIWKDKKLTDTHPTAYIQKEPGGEKINVLDLFDSMAEQWHDFLVGEGLWVEQPPDWDDQA